MESLSQGKGGWIRYEADNCPPTYLRYLPNERGRWVLRELMLDASESQPITPAVLALIPLQGIEGWLNGDAHALEYQRATLGEVSPANGPASGSNVAVLASHYATTAGATSAGQPMVDDWRWAAAWSLCDPDAYTALGVDELPKAVGKARPSRRRPKIDSNYRLTSFPGADGLTDQFLTDVARAYTAAMVRGDPPNKSIAASLGDGAEQRTVERWVYEARKRGIMPPARNKGARG